MEEGTGKGCNGGLWPHPHEDQIGLGQSQASLCPVGHGSHHPLSLENPTDTSPFRMQVVLHCLLPKHRTGFPRHMYAELRDPVSVQQTLCEAQELALFLTSVS